MHKVYPASAVANFLIKKGAQNPNNDLTHLKLQKLLYYAQGWFLANYERPLFEDNIEAWRYGPVVYSIYDQFKRMGDNIICKPIAGHFYHNGQFMQGEPMVASNDEETLDYLESFWEEYKDFDAYTLANATHMEGTPWYEVAKAYDFRPPMRISIPTEMIAEHFKILMRSDYGQ